MCILGKMEQDVGMVESIAVLSPSSMVSFGGFHPYMRLFSFRNLFCDLFLSVLFFVFFLGEDA